jgi:hypothetical protein
MDGEPPPWAIDVEAAPALATAVDVEAAPTLAAATRGGLEAAPSGLAAAAGALVAVPGGALVAGPGGALAEAPALAVAMDVEAGTMYPTMEEFKLTVRQFAIKKEFHLGVEKSCKTIYRAFCKSGDEGRPCPWRINARKMKGSATVEVNNVFIISFILFGSKFHVLLYIHICTLHACMPLYVDSSMHCLNLCTEAPCDLIAACIV